MAFKRKFLPDEKPSEAELTARMVGIGMNFAAEPDVTANIEDTLLYASELGMDGFDFRVLGVLTTWFGIHRVYVNADRLVRLIQQHESTRLRAYWSAMARWQAVDRRFAKLAELKFNDQVELLPTGTEFQIARRGEDRRFRKGPLRVPEGTLRDRIDDVLRPNELARLNSGYRNRIKFGASWRADAWTVLECFPDLAPAEVARRCYCSFATAWQAVQDFQLVRHSES